MFEIFVDLFQYNLVLMDIRYIVECWYIVGVR